MSKTKRLLALTAATAAMLAGSIAGAGSASAAHCTDDGSPGASYYGRQHVADNAGSDSAGGHNEGDHQGYSSCR